jgi:hypothetical protein
LSSVLIVISVECFSWLASKPRPLDRWRQSLIFRAGVRDATGPRKGQRPPDEYW